MTVSQLLAQVTSQAQSSSFFTDQMKIYSAKAYGAKGDGVTDDSAAINNAIAAANAAGGGIVYLPTGNFLVKTALNWLTSVDIAGASMWGTTITASGAIDAIDAVSAGPTYDNSGEVRDLTLSGVSGALIGLHVQYRQMIRAKRVRVTGFASQGMFWDYTIMGDLQDCLFRTNGDATHAQVEIDHSTTFKWIGNYISQSNAATVAGLRIDRTTTWSVVGGACETTGVPVQIGAKTEGTSAVFTGTIMDLDLENPNNGADHYIECGYGWTGAAGLGVRNLRLLNVNTSQAPSTGVVNAFKFKNCELVYIDGCYFDVPNTGTADIYLDGANNARFATGASNFSSAPAYVNSNGSTQPDARSSAPWIQGGTTLVLTKTALTQNSATPSAAGYSRVSTNSSVATTITNITGGVDGQVLYIEATDSNTTLKHLGTGAGEFSLLGGADLLLTVGKLYQFHYQTDFATPTWVQK